MCIYDIGMWHDVKRSDSIWAKEKRKVHAELKLLGVINVFRKCSQRGRLEREIDCRSCQCYASLAKKAVNSKKGMKLV